MNDVCWTKRFAQYSLFALFFIRTLFAASAAVGSTLGEAWRGEEGDEPSCRALLFQSDSDGKLDDGKDAGLNGLELIPHSLVVEPQNVWRWVIRDGERAGEDSHVLATRLGREAERGSR